MSRDTDILPHLDALRRYARTLARDETGAEDLVQEALADALSARRTFEGRNLRGWLLSILHNRFISDRRQAASEARRDAAVGALADGAVAAGQETHVHLGQIGRAIDRLPADQRAVLHLVAVEGMTYPQAAATLGVPEGTVMSRLSRARQALRAFEAGEAGETTSVRAPLKLVGGRDAT